MPFKKRVFGRGRAKRPYKKRGIYAKKKTRGVTTAVKKYVKSTIHRQIENKCVQINGGVSFGNYLESPDFNAFPICPLAGIWSIPQGVLQGNRVGNQIKTRKVYLNYIVRPQPYDAVANPLPRPLNIQLMLGYVKNTPCFQPAALDIQQLFQSGSSVSAPIGSNRDIISVINTDYWTIKKRWNHKIGNSNFGGTTASAPDQSQNQFYANNDYKLNAIMRMDITKYVPSLLQFNDSGVTPTSKNLFFMYYAVAATGPTNSATVLPANMEFWIDFHFEDA